MKLPRIAGGLAGIGLLVVAVSPLAGCAVAMGARPAAQAQGQGGAVAGGTQVVMVPMADGVKLATDVFVPAGKQPPFSTILVRTPYGKTLGKGQLDALGKMGYAVVSQDMRGRFGSEGHHAIIFGNDGLGGKHQDGHDTMRWVAKQPWSNGKIVTWGASALGIVQNMAAPNAPEELKGQVVIMAFSDYYHQAAYQGGVWRKELLEGWLKATKMEDVNLKTFLEHPTYDAFWKELSAEGHAEKVNAPGVFVGGWHDIFVQGTINAYTEIQKRGGPNAKGKCFLVIGPQAHGAYAEKVEYAKANEAPINLIAPMNVIGHWGLKPDPAVQKLQPVHYYVMGAAGEADSPGNAWRSADAWPPPSLPTPVYLHADRKLSLKKPEGEGELTYKYDPEKPVSTKGGQNLGIDKGPMDQRSVEERPDVLVFTSDKLAQASEVTGPVTAKLYISSDCPDTDFTVKLSDVYPDGRSMLVTDGIQRASLRKSFEKRDPLEPGKVYELNVDLWSTSQVFNKGHRIRVAVSSSNAPRFEPNPNTGEAHFTPGKGRVATNTVHLSAKHPSYVTLPLYSGAEGK